MEILIPTSTTSWERQLKLNTTCRAETFPARFFSEQSSNKRWRPPADVLRRQKLLPTISKPNVQRNRALIESSLLWPLATFGDPLKRHPQKLQEATASLIQLRPDSFAYLAWKLLEGVSVSSESLQVAVSAYSRTVLTKKNLRKMSLPCTLCSTAAAAPN